MFKSPLFVVLPLTSSSPLFCHGIASPHSFLAVFESGPTMFGEKYTSYHTGWYDGA